MTVLHSRRRIGTIVLLLLAMVVTLSSPLAALAQTPAANPVTTRPLNILLMGSDARPGEPIDGVRSDIMVVLHLDPGTRACRLLSIGRDTRIEMPGVGFTKINHALMHGGVPLATETVEGFLGIDIDHFGLIDFEGVSLIIDALGGVTIVNDEAFAIGGNEFPLGEQTLSGDQAVLFARYRGGADGDLGRMRRQQLVLTALLGQLQNASVASLLQATSAGLNDHVMTDLTTQDLAALATAYAGGCTAETLHVDTIPYASTGMYWDDLFGQELWFGVTDPAVVQQKVDVLVNGE